MDGAVSLPIVLSAVVVLLVVIVVAPFAFCCYFRQQSTSNPESGHLLEANNPSTHKRHSYNVTSSANQVSPSSKMSRRSDPSLRRHLPDTSPTPHSVSATHSSTSPPHSTRTWPKVGTGEKMAENAEALDKRGQTLGAIERQTVKLEDGAATFCSDAEKLVLKMQGKKASKGDKKKSKLKKLTLKHN